MGGGGFGLSYDQAMSLTMKQVELLTCGTDKQGDRIRRPIIQRAFLERTAADRKKAYSNIFASLAMSGVDMGKTDG